MLKIPLVAAILRDGDRFLLGKRSLLKKSAPGFWCPVTGKVEPDETEEEAVIRECREEAGIEVTAVRKVTSFDIDHGTARLNWWLVEILEGAPALANDEHTELRWVTIEEMEKLDPIFAEDVEVFRTIRNQQPVKTEISCK